MSKKKSDNMQSSRISGPTQHKENIGPFSYSLESSPTKKNIPHNDDESLRVDEDAFLNINQPFTQNVQPMEIGLRSGQADSADRITHYISHPADYQLARNFSDPFHEKKKAEDGYYQSYSYSIPVQKRNTSGFSTPPVVKAKEETYNHDPYPHSLRPIPVQTMNTSDPLVRNFASSSIVKTKAEERLPSLMNSHHTGADYARSPVQIEHIDVVQARNFTSQQYYPERKSAEKPEPPLRRSFDHNRVGPQSMKISARNFSDTRSFQLRSSQTAPNNPPKNEGAASPTKFLGPVKEEVGREDDYEDSSPPPNQMTPMKGENLRFDTQRLNTSVNEDADLLALFDRENKNIKSENLNEKKILSAEKLNVSKNQQNCQKPEKLLPKGVETIEQLQKLYEAQRSMKKIRHLDCFPKAHEAEILDVIFTPDEKFIISASADESIRIFNVQTKQQVGQIKDAHDNVVRLIAITSDAKYLVSGSIDKSIKVFEFAKILDSTQATIPLQPFHHFNDIYKDGVSCITITPDDKWIVSGSHDKSIKVFDIEQKKEVFHIPNAHEFSIRSLLVTSDNKLIISASTDRSIKIWNVQTQSNVYTFQNIHNDGIVSMAFVPQTNFIISGSLDESLKMIDVSLRKEIHCFKDQVYGQVSTVTVSHDGKFAFAGLMDGSIFMLDLKTKQLVKFFENVHNDRVFRIGISKDDDFLISCSSDRLIRITELKNKRKACISIKKAHHGLISSIAFSPDSRFFISGGDDGSVKIFDLQTGDIRKHSNFHSRRITSISMIPDSKTFVSGSEDMSIKVFDFWNESLVGHFQYLEAPVTCLATTKFHMIAAFGGEAQNPKRNSITVFSLALIPLYTLFNVHTAPINKVTITPDNKFIISCSDDKSIKVFNFDTRQQVRHLKNAHDDEILSVAVTPNNKFIVSASHDLSIKIFDIENANLVHTFRYAHNNPVLTLSISPDSRFIASSSSDKAIKIFDIETKHLVHHFQDAHNNWIWALAFSPDMKFIVSGSADGSIVVHDFEIPMEGLLILSPFNGEYLTAVTVSPDNQVFAYGSDSGAINVYDMKTKENVLFLMPPNYGVSVEGEANNLMSGGLEISGKIPLQKTIKSLAITPNNKFLISGGADKSIRIIDIDQKKEVYAFKDIHKRVIYAVAITPNSQFIVSGSEDKSIKIIDFKTKQLYHHFKEIHEDTVRSIAITSDSNFIISGSADRSIKILNIANKTLVYHFKGAHPRWIKSVAVSSDSNFLVSSSDDRSIKIFDFETRQLIHRFKDAHEDFIESVAITQDCRFIISASKDKSIKIFDVLTKQQVHHYQDVHQGRIKSIALTSDNKFIVSVSDDSSIRILPISPTLHSSKTAVELSKPGDLTLQSLIASNGLQFTKNEMYYIYNGSSKYFCFNAVDDFLFNSEMPPEVVGAIAIRAQQLTIIPFAWNILHLVAIKAHHIFIKNMPSYSQFKVPFLLDAFNKTPLHYLLAHENININSVNNVLTYICDYLEESAQQNSYQVQEIIISLTPLLWYILTETAIGVRRRFLNICFLTLPLPHGLELPAFGKPVSKAGLFITSLDVLQKPLENKLFTKGQKQIDFKANILNLDYNLMSQDMDKTIKSLQQQKAEEIFETRLVMKLIDHLWEKTKVFLRFVFVSFSLFIIALSVFLSIEDRCVPFEIVILCCAGFFLSIEVLQMINTKGKYFTDPWNWLDLTFYPLTIAFVIVRMLGNENELVRGWISAFIILSGYMRWISYLRVFKPARHLIQVIITVVNDMKSFITIIALIIFGFSIIFLVFNRGYLYGFYLYNAYGSLYGPADDENSSFSEKCFIAFIAFLLNVILLNLLISIMGTSYDRVLEERIRTDSLTRLDMISDAVTLLKFIRRQRISEKGFLIFCLPLNPSEDDDNERESKENSLEEKISMLRTQFKQHQDSTEQNIKRLGEELITQFENHKKNSEAISIDLKMTVRALMDQLMGGKNY